ncbi:MAG: phosphatase PAP2-related protein [Elusimicrobiota bacterium]
MIKWDTSRWSRARVLELAVALCGLGGAIAFNSFMGKIADSAGEAAHSSPDLLLSLLPRVDLRVLFVWGFAAFWAWAIGIALIRERRRLAHIAWLYSLLLLVRSLFIVLTPMRVPLDYLWVGGDPLYDALGRHLTFRNDLFFSSHTALPFLGYLIYSDVWARRVFLGFSIVLAATVLLTRLHYSIDVFAAYFITYAVYRFEHRWLRRPYRRLRWRILSGLAQG